MHFIYRGDRFFGNLHTHGTYLPSYFGRKKILYFKLYIL